MLEGKIAQLDCPEAVLERPASAEIAMFMRPRGRLRIAAVPANGTDREDLRQPAGR
jgi:hypothetical protein